MKQWRVQKKSRLEIGVGEESKEGRVIGEDGRRGGREEI